MKLRITVDENDADYRTTISPINDNMLATVREIAAAVKEFEPYTVHMDGTDWNHRANFPMGEAHRPDLGEKSAAEMYGHIEGFEDFLDLLPYCEWGFHSIESIEVVHESDVLL